MNDFDRALGIVLRSEGGKVDDHLDRGGRTNRGITQRTYDGWREDMGLDRQDVYNISDNEVHEIYRTLYWWVADSLEWPLSLVVFDSAVLFGAGRAGEWLAAVNWLDATPTEKAIAILCMRRERHRTNVARDKSQAKFWNGWVNRIDSLLKQVRAA